MQKAETFPVKPRCRKWPFSCHALTLLLRGVLARYEHAQYGETLQTKGLRCSLRGQARAKACHTNTTRSLFGVYIRAPHSLFCIAGYLTHPCILSAGYESRPVA
jgi:hypothetical protein